MRKTYKPIARTEKTSHMYRKKTLNVNDDLNVNHDQNDIEDVDEYWAAAASVIGNATLNTLDDTLIEQSDTIFNIKNKLKTDIKENENNIQLAHLSQSKQINKKVDLNEVTELKISESNKKANSLLKRRLTLKTEDDESTLSSINLTDLTKNKDQEKDISIRANTDFEIEFPAEESFENQSISASEIKIKTFDKTQKVSEEEFHEMKSNSTNNTNVSEIIPSIEENVNKKKMLKMPQAKTIKPISNKKSSPFQIENTKRLNSINKINPLVCTKTINTALFQLDYMAYTKDQMAENPFSLFITKGKIEITVNKKLSTMKQGEASIIEKGDFYSLKCISENGSSIFVSYSL